MMRRLPPITTLFPYTTLFRSETEREGEGRARDARRPRAQRHRPGVRLRHRTGLEVDEPRALFACDAPRLGGGRATGRDRKSTRLNSSHGYISYAVFCLKKKRN